MSRLGRCCLIGWAIEDCFELLMLKKGRQSFRYFSLTIQGSKKLLASLSHEKLIWYWGKHTCRMKLSLQCRFSLC